MLMKIFAVTGSRECEFSDPYQHAKWYRIANLIKTWKKKKAYFSYFLPKCCISIFQLFFPENMEVISFYCNDLSAYCLDKMLPLILYLCL